MKAGIVNASKSLLKLTGQEIGGKGKSNLKDAVIFSITHSIIEKADDIQFLMKNKRYESIEIISRTMLELYVSLKFILKEETERRALSYFYSYKKQMAKKINSTIDLMNEENHSFDLTESDLRNLDTEVPGITTIEGYKQHYTDLSTQLYSQGTNKENRKRWYDLNGNIRGFRELMVEVGMSVAEYEFFYGIGSMNVHGINTIGNLAETDGYLTVVNKLDLDLVNVKNSNYLIQGITSVVNYYKISKRKIRPYMTQMEINISQQGKDSK